MSDRKPRLAGAGGTFGKHQLKLAQSRQILVLRRASGADNAALACLDDAATLLGPLFAREQQALIRALGDDALDIPFACRLALLYPLVKHLKDPAGLLAGLARAFDNDLVSVGVG